MLEGAASEGAETERINLYDLNFKGCTGCNTCKLMDNESYGKCTYKDDLTPLLKRINDIDALILGSPIYFRSATGEMRSFLERLIYPRVMSKFQKNIVISFVYTTAASETQANESGLIDSLKLIEIQMKRASFELTEPLFIYNALQFDDLTNYYPEKGFESHYI